MGVEFFSAQRVPLGCACGGFGADAKVRCCAEIALSLRKGWECMERSFQACGFFLGKTNGRILPYGSVCANCMMTVMMIGLLSLRDCLLRELHIIVLSLSDEGYL